MTLLEKKEMQKTVKKERDQLPFLDKFVKKMKGIQDMELEKLIITAKNKKAWTNGHVLISQLNSLPEDYLIHNIDTQKPVDFQYPNIGKVIDSHFRDIAYQINIPKDYYKLLKPFNTGKKSQDYVILDASGIHTFTEDEECFFNYNIDFEIDFSIRFNLFYIYTFKPAELFLSNSEKAAFVAESYKKKLNQFDNILIMPMKKNN
jgi:hypothetical protein